ncbi:MAG TPA: glycosyltransferase, partial [Anaerolineae bacterium]|nr:glycosyltransferase [Anaerolineae bacterium]HIQ04140.1 glycosyltransferase [Anaerolineae bacterium]
TLAVSYFPKQNLLFQNISVPYKILEYLGAGVPMVLSDNPPHQVLTEHGVSSYIVPATVEGLVEGIERLLDDETLADRLRRGARETAQRYDFAAIAGQVEAVYERALET